MKDIKILIVEDEFIIGNGLARKLKKLGYKITEIVATGEDAIKQVKYNTPDLILMDIALEGDLDGIETAAQILNFENLPIIYLTAYDDDKTIERAQATGGLGFLLKPCKEREIHATIKMALKKHEETKNLLTINEEKSRYINTISHDVRNPLTVILSSTEMIKTYGDILSEEIKQRHFEQIKSSVIDINQILEEFLALSQDNSSGFVLQLLPVNLRELAAEIMHKFQYIAGKKYQFNLNIKMPQEIEIQLDERLLSHIVSNLLSNAIKYSPNGGNIDLKFVVNNNELIFTIKDEGIGIPNEYKNQIFKQFQRGENVGKIKGTGLGLSIVKKAVELHGGKITFESELNQGTTFTVILPINYS